jgi:hypothetical protein
MEQGRPIPPWSRRGFLAASAAAAGLSLPGCCRRAGVRTTDPDIGRADRPETLAVLTTIRAGKVDELHERLRGHLFEVATPGVHFARFTIMPEEKLLFSLVFDDHRRVALDFLARNAKTVDPILQLCEGWPADGAENRDALDRWVTAFSHPILLLYSAFSRGSEPAIRESVALRDDFLRMVHAVTVDPARAESEYHAFLLANRARMDVHEEGGTADLPAFRLVDPQEQNPFTMVFKLRPGQAKRLDITLRVGEWAIEHFHVHPLRQIPTVHYARFASMRDERVLFMSVYDGDWDQYVDDFAAMIPGKLDMVWGGAEGYPRKGAADAPALQRFLEANRIERDFFFAAEQRRTVKEIQASLALGEKLVRWSREVPARDAALVRRIHRFVREHQRLLA